MKGRVIAVTGAFGALGRSILADLSARGAVCVAIDVVGAPDSSLAAQVLPNVDISNLDAATTAVAQIRERFGRLDGLANIAGGFLWEPILGGDPANWDALYRTNVRTALVMSMAAAEALIETRGAIVNVGAAAAAKGGFGMGAYAAAKGGVARLTESLAEELKDKGVRVNAVLPTIIDTPANRIDMPDSDTSQWVSPAAIARVVAFLLSDDAAAINGATLPVSGGL